NKTVKENSMIEARNTKDARGYNKGRRVALSVACLVTSLLGMLGSLTFIVGGFDVYVSVEQETQMYLVVITSCLLGLWCASFVMVWGWMGNSALQTAWPVIYAISGASSIYLAGFLSRVALTAFLLTIYLISFHVTGGTSRSQQVPYPVLCQV